MIVRVWWLFGTAALALACGGGQQPPAESASDVDTASSDDPTASDPTPAGGEAADAADANFAIAAVAQPPFAVGGAARAEVTLEGRNGYHVNQEYPIELRIVAPEGVDLAKASLARADASVFEEARAVFPVEFTPRQPGRKEFSGELSFSVCNEQNCLMERRPVAFAVDVP